MAAFPSPAAFEAFYREFFRRALSSERIGPKLAAAGIVVRFEYTFEGGPPVVITADLKSGERPAGLYGALHFGDGAPWSADVTFTQTGELGNRFWQGQVNVLAALAKREIRASGAITKALGLLPAIRPAYRLYADLLKEKGHAELVLLEDDD